MLRHNLLFFFRNAKRFKSSFFINLIGLSTGLACTLLIYMSVHDELSFDKFHKNDKQLFQAKLNYHNSDGIATARATPALLAESLAEEMPEVEYAVATTSGIEMPLFLLSSKDKSIKATGQFVLIAIVIAFPVALWATNKWLQDFAYKADIQWWLYALAATTAILIALVAVSSQAIKAAIANPAKSLRTE